MPYLPVDEINLFYQVSGNGLPLVLISGYQCNLNIWAPILPYLEKKFRILRFDHRGVGNSKGSTLPFSMHQMSEDLHWLVDKLGFTHAFILGSSMGAAIAQIFAKCYPTYIRKLILANAFIELKPKTKMLLQAFTRLMKHSPQQLVIEAVIPWLFSDCFIEDPENLLRYLKMQSQDISIVSMENQSAALRAFSSRSWYTSIPCETLIIHGEQDVFCPIDDAFALAEGIPKASLHTFAQSAHMSHIETPEEFSETVSNFLLNPASNF